MLGSIIGGAIGALAGGAGDASGSRNSGQSISTVNLQDFSDLNKGASGLENAAYNSQLDQFKQLQQLLTAGPGQNEVSSNTQYQNNFAGQLSQMLQRLNNPTSADIAGNYQQAQNIFAPQQTALNQQFSDANVQSNRLAARLGRPGNDPILRNKLLQEQTRQQTMLNSQVGSFAANELPQQQSQNLMNVGGALSNLRQGLASQAFQNRSSLLQMGNQLTNAERQYRLSTATRTNDTSSNTQNSSGGGLGGIISGALGGAGSLGGGIQSAIGGIGSLFGGGGSSSGAMNTSSAGGTRSTLQQ